MKRVIVSTESYSIIRNYVD